MDIIDTLVGAVLFFVYLHMAKRGLSSPTWKELRARAAANSKNGSLWEMRVAIVIVPIGLGVVALVLMQAGGIILAFPASVTAVISIAFLQGLLWFVEWMCREFRRHSGSLK